MDEGCVKCPACLLKNVCSVTQSQKTYQHMELELHISWLLHGDKITDPWEAWWLCSGVSLYCSIVLEFKYNEGLARKELGGIYIG